VKVGDVGIMRWGKFHRFFNALLPADHPSHDLGVPEYHEPLVPNLVDHINMGSLNCGHYCSSEVNIVSEPNTSASSPDDLPQVSYMCARRRQGALSLLPVNVRRENTLAWGDFGEWMLKHIDNWFAFARRLGLGIVQMEELILITGCDRTKSWTNVCFLGNNVDARVSFGMNAAGSPNPSINFQLSPANVRGAVVNRGPEGTVCWYSSCKGRWSRDSFDTTPYPLGPTRESMYLYSRFSCRSSPWDIAKAPQGCGRSLSRPRGL